MQYETKTLTIRQLIDFIDSDKIDLNPSYQRNFIWSPKDQKELIDTIKQGFPLPAFFIYQKPNGKMEMVDGQQRSKTIYQYIKGKFLDNQGDLFSPEENEQFLNYQITCTFITDLQSSESLNDYYVRINKKGKHLNTPEVHKSEFESTNLMTLCNELLSDQDFIELNLFTDASAKRMNDRAFVEELVIYLKYGITDKKDKVEATYKVDISREEVDFLKSRFLAILSRISNSSSNIAPIYKTRYKQKNDFYTFFNFLDKNTHLNRETDLYQYRILILFDGKELETGLQFIRPTNEECPPFKSYAINCVSQSNSKNARISRLRFFEDTLKNTESYNNQTLIDVMSYLGNVLQKEFELCEISEYQLINLD